VAEETLRTPKSNQGYLELMPERKILECENNLELKPNQLLKKQKTNKKKNLSEERWMALTLGKKGHGTVIFLAMSLKYDTLAMDCFIC